MFRPNSTRRKAALLAVLAAGVSFAATSYAADPPRLKFKAELPLQLPNEMNFGEIAGVAVNSKGHVFVFSRGDKVGPLGAAMAAQLLEFDQNGKYVREIGRHLYAWGFAEKVRIDKDDNIWAIDKASNMVVRFTPDGRFAEHYARPEEPQEFHPFPSREVAPDLKAPKKAMGTFGEPTDIAWDSKGFSYVTDGYEMSRVQKWKDAKAVKAWGERGTGPGQFYIPHAIVIDSKDNVYVGDRGNGRVQVFDTDGKFQRQFTLMGQVPYYKVNPEKGNPNPLFMPDEPLKPRGDDPSAPKAFPDAPPADLSAAAGAPWAMCITPGQNQVLFVGDSNPSRIYKVGLDGKVLGMLGEPGGKLGEFRVVHALACPDDRTLWVADMAHWRVQKITLQ